MHAVHSDTLLTHRSLGTPVRSPIEMLTNWKVVELVRSNTPAHTGAFLRKIKPKQQHRAIIVVDGC